MSFMVRDTLPEICHGSGGVCSVGRLRHEGEARHHGECPEGPYLDWRGVLAAYRGSCARMRSRAGLASGSNCGDTTPRRPGMAVSRSQDPGAAALLVRRCRVARSWGRGLTVCQTVRVGIPKTCQTDYAVPRAAAGCGACRRGFRPPYAAARPARLARWPDEVPDRPVCTVCSLLCLPVTCLTIAGH